MSLSRKEGMVGIHCWKAGLWLGAWTVIFNNRITSKVYGHRRR